MINICTKCANQESCNPKLDFKVYDCRNYEKKSNLVHVSTSIIIRYQIDPGDTPYYIPIKSRVDVTMLRVNCRNVTPFVVTTVDVVEQIAGKPTDEIGIPSEGHCIVRINDVDVSFKNGRFYQISKGGTEWGGKING